MEACIEVAQSITIIVSILLTYLLVQLYSELTRSTKLRTFTLD